MRFRNRKNFPNIFREIAKYYFQLCEKPDFPTIQKNTGTGRTEIITGRREIRNRLQSTGRLQMLIILTKKKSVRAIAERILKSVMGNKNHLFREAWRRI